MSQKANLKHIILSEPLLSLFIFSLLYPLTFYMFSFSPSQGLLEHKLVISHGIMIGNYVKRKKKWCLMKRWAKLPKVKNKKEKEKKCSFMFLRFYVERAWNQKEVQHWWLKMENLCALIKYLVWNIIFHNALLSLVWTFSFTLFYLTLTLAPLQPENKIFWFMHCL